MAVDIILSDPLKGPSINNNVSTNKRLKSGMAKRIKVLV
jgi:hypothetical protein